MLVVRTTVGRQGLSQVALKSVNYWHALHNSNRQTRVRCWCIVYFVAFRLIVSWFAPFYFLGRLLWQLSSECKLRAERDYKLIGWPSQ